MLNFISCRENGTADTRDLSRAESTRRVFMVDISKNVDIEKVHTGSVNTLNLDAVENRYLLSGSANGTIAIHDLHNISGLPKYSCSQVGKIDRKHRNGHKFSIETVQWYPVDTGMFLSSGTDKTLKVWDTNYLKTADEFEFNGVVYTHDMSSVATQHSLIVAATQSAKVKLLDLKSGSATHTLRGHKKPVLTAKWSTKDEFILATGGEDSKVYMWDVRSSKGSLMVLDQHNGDTEADANSVNTAHNGHVNGLCFTQDGLHLITFGTDERMRLWSTGTGRNTLVNYGSISNDSRKCIKLAVSEDTQPGLIFVPSGGDIDVYDIFTGEQLNTLRGHYNQVNCVIYNWQDQFLYSGANDRNILVWQPQTSAVTAYENYLLGETAVESLKSFVKRVGTTDAWSSDED